MKIDNETLTNMENDLDIIINHLNIDKTKLNVNDINNLWFYVFTNRSYNIENKNVFKDSSGNRILSQIDNFELYPNNTNDTTIYTAWKKLVEKWNK